MDNIMSAETESPDATMNTAPLIPRWPDRFDPNRGASVPGELMAATILGIGTSDERVEGGGFLIDYRPANSPEVHRLALAFNDLGMWIHRQSNLGVGRECDS